MTKVATTRFSWEGGTFECERAFESQWVNRLILEGQTYPILPFIGPVSAVVDIGANAGAAACHFARAYPEATVYALEPAAAMYTLCTRNVAQLDNVVVERVALHERDGEALLYAGSNHSMTASLTRSDETFADGETVVVRDAAAWARERGLSRLDIVKIDTEGSEVPILRALEPLLPSVKVLYVEYHSDDDRRTIDGIVASTHVLALGLMTSATGEVVYLNRHEAPDGFTLAQWGKRTLGSQR